MPFNDSNNTGGDSTNSDGKPGQQGDASQQGSNNDNQNQQGDNQSVYLVVGDRAFKTQEDVIKHIANAQGHIATLEQERVTDREANSQLTEEVGNLSKIVDAIPRQDANQSNSGNDSQTENLSSEELIKRTVELVKGSIQSDATATQQNTNLSTCETKAKELYGDQFQETVLGLGKKLGMNGAQVDALGKDSPDAFARLFLNAEHGSSSMPAHEGGMNSSALNQDNNSDQGNQHKNITKLRERDRISHVANLMKQNGISY